MVKEAFEKWLKTQPESAGNRDTDEFLRRGFEAGWNAARAEPRSDAAVPTGGRRVEPGLYPTREAGEASMRINTDLPED